MADLASVSELRCTTGLIIGAVLRSDAVCQEATGRTGKIAFGPHEIQAGSASVTSRTPTQTAWRTATCWMRVMRRMKATLAAITVARIADSRIMANILAS